MSHKIFNNNLLAIRKSKVSLKLKKPTYTGVCILELIKVLIYRFHYDYVKNRYDNKSKLLHFFYKHNAYKHIQSGISEKKELYAEHAFQPRK